MSADKLSSMHDVIFEPDTSDHTAELLGAVRRRVPFVEHDRTLSAEIGALADAILSGEVSKAVERSLGHPLV